MSRDIRGDLTTRFLIYYEIAQQKGEPIECTTSVQVPTTIILNKNNTSHDCDNNGQKISSKIKLINLKILYCFYDKNMYNFRSKIRGFNSSALNNIANKDVLIKTKIPI